MKPLAMKYDFLLLFAVILEILLETRPVVARSFCNALCEVSYDSLGVPTPICPELERPKCALTYPVCGCGCPVCRVQEGGRCGAKEGGCQEGLVCTERTKRRRTIRTCEKTSQDEQSEKDKLDEGPVRGDTKEMWMTPTWDYEIQSGGRRYGGGVSSLRRPIDSHRQTNAARNNALLKVLLKTAAGQSMVDAQEKADKWRRYSLGDILPYFGKTSSEEQEEEEGAEGPFRKQTITSKGRHRSGTINNFITILTKRRRR